MHSSKTIVAIATPPGYGGIGIIRVSGEKAFDIGCLVTKINLKNRYVHFASFYDLKNDLIDNGIALFFRSPHSYTGENVVELQTHGNPIILEMLLQIIITYGARIANPGEFTERAYLNDKMDLAQAEAVMDIISASSEKSVKASAKSLQGKFSNLINNLLNKLISLRVYIESAIDFPEEEIDFLKKGSISLKLNEIKIKIVEILNNAKQGSFLQEGLKCIMVGKPNSGKSSLLNRLSEKDVAIVTDIEGTTRDILETCINISGIPVFIVDTAGLRRSQDIVEKKGVDKTIKLLKEVDHIFVVIDSYATTFKDISDLFPDFYSHFKDNIPITYIYNKIDLLENNSYFNHDNRIYISAKKNIGIEELKKYIFDQVVSRKIIPNNEGIFIARKRHIHALNEALVSIQKAEDHCKNYESVLLAEELNYVQRNLSSITGQFTSDDLLTEIFQNFCIGK